MPGLVAFQARDIHARRDDGADGRSVFFPLLIISEQWGIRVFWVLGSFLDAVFWKISGKFLENFWIVSERNFLASEPFGYASHPPCTSLEGGSSFLLPLLLALGANAT
mgnify:CR=1 FL=1